MADQPLVLRFHVEYLPDADGRGWIATIWSGGKCLNGIGPCRSKYLCRKLVRDWIRRQYPGEEREN